MFWNGAEMWFSRMTMHPTSTPGRADTRGRIVNNACFFMVSLSLTVLCYVFVSHGDRPGQRLFAAMGTQRIRYEKMTPTAADAVRPMRFEERKSVSAETEQTADKRAAFFGKQPLNA